MGHAIEEYQDYILCYTGKRKGHHGVGFLIKKKHKNNIINFLGISERVALLQLKFEGTSMSIVQLYAPTERSSEEEMDSFYNDIKKAHLLADDFLIVIGDLNAKIGCRKLEEDLIMGKYGYGERNERGKRLIEYAFEYKLAIMNTFFKKKDNRKWTWISPNQKFKNEIDFIMTNKPKSITNIEVINKINFASDHRLVRATVNLNTPKKTRTNFRPTFSKLKSSEEKGRFTNELKVNIENLTMNQNDVQMCYNLLEETILNSLKKINVNKNDKENSILSNSTKELIKQRTELILVKNKDKNTRNKLTLLFKDTNKSIRKDYAKHRHNVITKNLDNYRSTKRAAKELNLHKPCILKLNIIQKKQELGKTWQTLRQHFTKNYIKEEMMTN